MTISGCYFVCSSFDNQVNLSFNCCQLVQTLSKSTKIQKLLIRVICCGLQNANAFFFTSNSRCFCESHRLFEFSKRSNRIHTSHKSVSTATHRHIAFHYGLLNPVARENTLKMRDEVWGYIAPIYYPIHTDYTHIRP